MTSDETRTSRLLARIKNNKALSILIVVGVVVVVGISGFYKAIFDIFDTTSKLKTHISPESASNQSSQIAEFESLEFNVTALQVGRQSQPLWGWAASIQSILGYHGILVSQEDIVSTNGGMPLTAK